MIQQQKIDALYAAIAGTDVSEFRGDTRVVVPREAIHQTLELLYRRLGFDMLVDITCVDYLRYRCVEGDGPRQAGTGRGRVGPRPDDARTPAVPRNRFGLVYLLADTESNERLTVRAFVNDPEPTVPSVVDLWQGADWMEREVWDMFGIRFSGHPDLRRILLPEEFTAHPLRKDYPLQGRGERHNFPVLTRAEG
jgi:NADH-quinone oxidoreductase subunit C